MSDVPTSSNPSTIETKPNKARKNAPREFVWASYVHKVLKAVHPDLQISRDGTTVLSDALDDLMERLAAECKQLVQSNNRATLTARDVEAAVKLLIPPGDIQNLARKQANEAVARAESNKS